LDDEKLCLIVRIELTAGDCTQHLFFHESREQENEDEVLPFDACDHLLRKMGKYWRSWFVTIAKTLNFVISQQ
jgi:hypothetical protein